MIGYLRTLLLFYTRHLRVQPLRELMAIAGVAAGVALLFAVQVAHRSITGSFEEITHGVAGHATLELAARRPEGFNQNIAEAVEHMPEVRATAPIFEQPIVVVGPRGRRAVTLLGANEQIDALGGSLALEFQRVGEASKVGLLVLTEHTAREIGARRGHEVTVLVAERTEHLTLDAVAPSAKIGPVAESPVAAAPLPIVQALAKQPGQLTRVLIQPRPGREADLRRRLTARYGQTLNVRSIDAEATLLGNAAGPERQITLLFSAISIIAGIILAYNALLLATNERRRFVTYLIKTGTPDAMIIGSLAFDALALGLIGSALGLLAGELVSLIAYRTVPGYITAAFAVGGQRIVDSRTILIALAGGMFAAVGAASLPALVIMRSSAVAEPEAVGRTLALTRKMRLSDMLVVGCGILLVGGSIAAAALFPSITVVALVALAGGLVICMPAIGRLLLKLARAAIQHSGDPSARLSVAELRSSPPRSVALLATGTIAAFLMVLIGGSVSDVQTAVRRGAGDLLSSANLWIKPGGPENVYTTQPFAYAETQRRLQRLSVVESVLPWRDSFLDLPGRRVWVLSPPPQIAEQIVPSQIVEGSLANADRHLNEGGWVTASQTIAREYRVHLGQRFRLPTPAGYVDFRLAATTANYGWLSGAIIMNGEDHARLWNNDTATELAVTLKPGVSDEAGKQAIERTLPAHSALNVSTATERRSEVSAVLGSTLSRLSDTTIVVLVTTITSVIALMMAAVWQSQRRLNSLMSIGMSFWQFVRLIFYESGTMLLSGCLIGAVIGLVGQDLIDGWLRGTTGSPVQFAPAWELGVRTIAIAAIISLATSIIAVVRTTGLQPTLNFSTE
jgi:putative ABC transport system permease protein